MAKKREKKLGDHRPPMDLRKALEGIFRKTSATLRSAHWDIDKTYSVWQDYNFSGRK